MAVPGMGLKFPVQVGIELESKAPCPPRESPSSPSLQVLVIYKFPRYDHTTPERIWFHLQALWVGKAQFPLSSSVQSPLLSSPRGRLWASFR